MGKVYGEAKVCLDGNENGEQCYNLEPELTDIMAESHNFTLRTYIWQVSLKYNHFSHALLANLCITGMASKSWSNFEAQIQAIRRVEK